MVPVFVNHFYTRESKHHSGASSRVLGPVKATAPTRNSLERSPHVLSGHTEIYLDEGQSKGAHLPCRIHGIYLSLLSLLVILQEHRRRGRLE